MNKCIFSGNTSTDVTMRVNGDKQNARVSLAVPRPFAKEGQKTADFINLVAFDKKAEVFEKYVPKGRHIIVETHLTTSQYEKDGTTRYSTDYVVDNVELGPKPANTSAAEPTAAPNNAPAQNDGQAAPTSDGFMNIPDGFDDENVPWRR